jgi:hypothetical protein
VEGAIEVGRLCKMGNVGAVDARGIDIQAGRASESSRNDSQGQPARSALTKRKVTV